MHNIHYATYEKSVSKRKVQKHWDTVAAREDYQEGCSGLDRPIRWIESPVLKDYEQARNYIETHDRGWYDQLAVQFKDEHTTETGRKTHRTMWLVKIEYHT